MKFPVGISQLSLNFELKKTEYVHTPHIPCLLFTQLKKSYYFILYSYDKEKTKKLENFLAKSVS